MSRNIINIGVEGDQSSGDSLRLTGMKLNENFEELYKAISDLDTRTTLNVPTATRWQSPRVLLLQDEVSGSVLVDGSENILLKAKVDATVTVAANKIVRRDAEGGFAAALVQTSQTTTTRPAVAERLRGDAQYSAGTVVVVGGDRDVTQSTKAHDTRVVGVVTVDPGMTLNANRGTDLDCPRVVVLGRVQCKVVGPVAKGDMLTTSDVPGHAQTAHMVVPGTIIGKALQSIESDGVIEIVVSLH